MNATYIISIARKLGCSIFLLPEDMTEVYVLRSGALLGHQLQLIRSLNLEAEFLYFSFNYFR